MTVTEEDSLQITVATYLRVALPDNVIWWHTPNGGSRNKREAVKLKRMGTRPGVPDLTFILPDGRAAFIELKTKDGRLSREQNDFRDACRASNAVWALARSLDDVESIVSEWGLPVRIKMYGGTNG